MVQILVVAGASVFALLGTLHALLTLRGLPYPKAFMPRDAALVAAMEQASLRLHPSINLWRAWLGFNLSHSLGVVMFGLAFLHVGLFEPGAFAASLLLQGSAVAVSAIYLLLSLKFWFSRPAIGSALALVSFAAAALLAHV